MIINIKIKLEKIQHIFDFNPFNFINMYTYSLASIVLFGFGLIAIIGLYPANTTAIKAQSFDANIYTAVSIDYSNLDLAGDLS